MKNSKLINLMAVAITSASLLVGCNENDMGSKDNTNDKAQVEENLAEEKLVDATNMVVEDDGAKLVIQDVQVIKDYDGNDALIINYDFTNKGDEPTSALMEVYMEAFQNGKQIESSAFIESNEYNEQLDVMKDITMEDCWYTFSLQGKDEVTLYVKADWLSNDKSEFKINLNDLTIIRTDN